MRENHLEKLYRELRKKYGKPKGQWSLWCKRPKTEKEREEVVMGAILTQRTNWKNVEIAINNLKKARINSLRALCRTDKRRLVPLIKPSGFYRMKARYLFSLTKFIIENYGSLEKSKNIRSSLSFRVTKAKVEKKKSSSIPPFAPLGQMRKEELKELRKKLLKIKGIGPETADSVLLYALDKPIFVIDEYTKRLVREKRLSPDISYAFLQKLFEKNLKRDFRLFQDFHALIVIDGKNSR